MKKLTILAGALCAAAMPANAATFTETFNASGSLNGVLFTAKDLTLTGTSVQPGNGDPHVSVVPLTSATVSGLFDSGLSFTATFSGSASVFSNNDVGTQGFSLDGPDIADVISKQATDLNSPFTASGYLLGNLSYNFATDQGAFQISSFTQGASGTFTTSVASVTSAVPEPASWALMIGGIGLAGGMMRRQRRVTTEVAFA